MRDSHNYSIYPSCGDARAETISTFDIRRRLGDFLNRVALRQDEFIIERNGKPLAAMVSVQKLRFLEDLARARLLDVLAQRPKGLSQEEADLLSDEAKHRSRKRGAR